MNEKCYIAIDVETTGLSAREDRIVEIGALAFDPDGKDISQFQSLVNPGRPIPQEVIAIHGITDEMVKDAEPAGHVIQRLDDFIENVHVIYKPIFIAHNSYFDVSFINYELFRIDPVLFFDIRTAYDVLCTKSLAQRRLRFSGISSYSLSSLVQFLNLPPQGFHRALADCHNVKNLLLSLKPTDEEEFQTTKYPLKIKRPVTCQ